MIKQANNALPRRSLSGLAEDKLHWGTATELAAKIKQGEISAVQAISASLARISEINPQLNCFCDVYQNEALERANALDKHIAANGTDNLPPLAGVPFALKDMTPAKGKRTTLGCRAFADAIGSFDPIILQRLEAAGAIQVGKTTTSEIASAALTETELFGITRNPWDPSRTPGGSSGGAAVAVASGCVPIAEGTDWGGSIRSPAAYCGIVGLKPSSGRIPMDILPSVSDDLPHFGPLASCVDDAALFLQCTAGPSDADLLSLPSTSIDYTTIDGQIEGRHFAVNYDYGYYGLEASVRANMERMVDALRDRGATIVPVDIQWSEEIDEAWYNWWKVYLAAFFGDDIEKRPEFYGEVVRKQCAEGKVLSAVEYKRIELVRSRMWRDLAKIFAQHEALILPATTRTAPPTGLTDDDLVERDAFGRLLGVSMHFHLNFVPQCPAMSVPTGFAPNGLPTSVQILGRRYADEMVLKIGKAIESTAFGGSRMLI